MAETITAPTEQAPTPAPAAPTNSPEAPANERHPGLSSLMDALIDTVPEEPKKKEKKSEPAEPAKPPAATPPVEAERQIKVRKPAPAKRPDLPVEREPEPTHASPPVQSAPVNDKAWEESLLDNEKDMLADARYAEEKFPDKFKGLGAKTQKFLRDHAALVEKPDFDQTSDEYQSFLKKNRPSLAERDVRDITESRVADRVRGEVSPKIVELEHELFKRDEEPKIEQAAIRVFSRLANESLPDEMMKAFKDAGGGENGVKAMRAEFAMEFEIANSVIEMATGDISEFMRITKINPKTNRPLTPIARDQNDPKWDQHNRLSKMVTELGEDFKTAGGPALQKDGKWFVTRDEWLRIPPAQRNQFWTFTNEELMDRAQRHVKVTVANIINQERDRMAKRGWQRTPKAAPAASPAVPPGPSAPNPSPRPSMVPGSSQPQNGASTEGAKLASLLNQG